MSDVTIHIDETLDSTTLQALQHNLSRIDGIDHIDAQESRPHLMVVSFDHQAMSSAAILSSFTNQGLHAELIGF